VRTLAGRNHAPEEIAWRPPEGRCHCRTLLPGHRYRPLKSGKCYPCVGSVLFPMSRGAQRSWVNDL